MIFGRVQVWMTELDRGQGEELFFIIILSIQ